MFRLVPYYGGFKGLRLLKRTDKTICFVDYHDVSEAALAMEQLQGFRIDPRDNGMRIEFDRGSERSNSSSSSSSRR